MHSAGREGAKGREKFRCLDFPCLALEYKLLFYPVPSGLVENKSGDGGGFLELKGVRLGYLGNPLRLSHHPRHQQMKEITATSDSSPQFISPGSPGEEPFVKFEEKAPPLALAPESRQRYAASGREPRGVSP